jgi:D-alanyl-D-alanine carboxypeptidase
MASSEAVPLPAEEPVVVAAVAPSVAVAPRREPEPRTELEPVGSAPSLSGWMVQIGAGESKAAADALLARARSKTGKALAGAEPVTETVSKGSQTFVRARFAGFDSEKAASRACAALKKSAFACYTLRL